jgi:hypothetical protein
MSVFLFFVNDTEFSTLSTTIKSYLKNPSNVKVIAIFTALFLAWALSRSAADWVISPNYVGDPCDLFDSLYDNNSSCGLEDLNNSKRIALADLIDKFASALFIVAPFNLMHRRINSWITGQ